MRSHIHNGKKVIWESKQKRLLLIFVNFLFAAVTLFNYRSGKAPAFLIIIIFFVSIGVLLLYQFLNPKNLFVKPGSELAKEILELYNDLGQLSYEEHGFCIKALSGDVYYKWDDIQAIFGYKLDLITIDEICVDIFFDDGSSIKLDESRPGWSQFDQQLIDHNLSVPPNWQADIAFPAFATNHTLLFDKKGRTQERAMELYNVLIATRSSI